MYRLTMRLTDGAGPCVSEVEEFVFSAHDIMRAFDHDFGEPLFVDPSWDRWQGDPDPLPGTLWQVVELPSGKPG